MHEKQVFDEPGACVRGGGEREGLAQDFSSVREAALIDCGVNIGVDCCVQRSFPVIRSADEVEQRTVPARHRGERQVHRFRPLGRHGVRDRLREQRVAGHNRVAVPRFDEHLGGEGLLE